MSSDYSVIRISSHSPSGGHLTENRSAFVIRKHSTFDEKRKNIAANLTDDEILLTSLEYAQRKTDKTVAGKLENALPSLFVTAVPLVFGALCKGTLSSKLKTALSTAFIFGTTMTICNKYNKGMDRIENVSGKIEKARAEHPVAAGIFDIAAKGLLLLGASVALFKSGKFLQNKFKPSADKLADSISKASERIDKSLAGRGVEKLNNKTDMFLDKHPKIAKFVSKNAFLAPAAALLGWIGFEEIVHHKAFEKKYKYASNMANELFLHREIARNSD